MLEHLYTTQRAQPVKYSVHKCEGPQNSCGTMRRDGTWDVVVHEILWYVRCGGTRDMVVYEMLWYMGYGGILDLG